MFPNINPFSQAPVRAPEAKPLLSQTNEASTSQQPGGQSSTPPGSMFSRTKSAWLNSTLSSSFTGNTELHQAAQAGDLVKIRILLDKPVDHGKVNNKGQTPLHCAVEKGDLDIVNVLLDHPNVRPNVADSDGLTSLHYAVKKGDVGIVKALLNHPGIDLTKADKNRSTLLHDAVKNGDLEIAKALLNHPRHESIWLNVVDKNGHTPFYYAVADGYPDLIRLLAQKGANPTLDVKKDQFNKHLMTYKVQDALRQR